MSAPMSTRREWWRRRRDYGINAAPFAIELDVHDDHDVPVGITDPILTRRECTAEPSDLLTWRTLSKRAAAELVMVANHSGGFSAFELLEWDPTPDLPVWQLPLKKKGDARIRRRAASPEAIEKRRDLERNARAAVAHLATRELDALRADLELHLQAVEDEHTMRWAELSDEAMRIGRHDLDPQNRRGAPVWWMEDDFPNHQALYDRRHAKMGIPPKERS